MSTIWDALRKKDVAAVKSALASGTDANESGAGDQTPLHLASELDAKECVSALLAAKAKVGVEDGQLRTPLLLACESRAFGCAQLLIEAGAPLGARDKNDMTPLHWMAAHGADVPLIQQAVTKGADIDAVNFMMQSPLHYAVTKGQFTAATKLVDLGASLVVDDESKATVVHLAMQHSGGTATDESLALLKKLLAAAKGKFDANTTDREKRTPLHWAAGNNALPCVEALLAAKATVDARDWGEHTPMHWACPMDAIESVKVLAAAGADLNAVDRDRRTPLHWAAEKGAEGCLAFLLEQSGVTVDAVDWGGYSPLHSASRRGSVGCINLLLAKGANADLAALSGETPAEVAGSAEAKSLLASKGSASPGIKRKRSSGSIALEGSLPELADALYSAIAKKGAKEVYTSLCDEATGAALAKWAASVMKAGLTVGTKHVSTKTASVHTELTLGDRGKTKLLHQLTFDEDGLIVGSVVYTAAK